VCNVRVEGRDKKFETLLVDKLAEGRSKLAETLEQRRFSQVSPARPPAKGSRIVKGPRVITSMEKKELLNEQLRCTNDVECSIASNAVTCTGAVLKAGMKYLALACRLVTGWTIRD
jgi:hypothetical protein